MGDRANIHFKDDKDTNGVFFYTHWAGTELPATLQAALQHNERWDDPQYLSRIIFCEMVGNDAGFTGYGISSVIGDGEGRVLVVDADAQTISYGKQSWTFDEYVALSADAIAEVWS